KEVALFVAPTRTYGELMRSKLGLTPEKLQVVYNGISLEGYGSPESTVQSPESESPASVSKLDNKSAVPSTLDTRHSTLSSSPVTRHSSPFSPPSLGYFARMCKEK